ncbi:MAG: ABC transporter ATP-binding protein [Chitinophagaceae bacterium]|nr:ABC transporter ATP-binding protein [Chitinophagaceae bacterium]MCW5914685.1 ABC transporter ATP-binding protein [Chitinophagaceae bacterium]MCZ2395200.1 ABC transporter ATP-binding protein/permease [Chitinophagales bacterium]
MNDKKKILDFKVLTKIIRLAAPYKKKFFLSIFLSVILAIISPVRPYLIQYTINHFIQDKNTFWLIMITVIQVGLLLIETLLRFYFGFITSWLGQYVVNDLRLKVFNKVLSFNLRQYDKTPIGTLTTRTINDIEAVNNVFSDGLIPIIADLLSIVSILLFMFGVDWRLSLISLAPFPILIIATYFFKESVNKSFIKVRNAVAALNAFVQEHLSGMHVVQAYTSEKREFAKFREINNSHRRANIRAIFAYSVFFPVVEIVLAVSIGLLVWWGGNYSADAGVIISFIMYLNLLFRPLRVIADKFNTLQMGMVAGERVFQVLDNPDVTDTSKSVYIPAQTKGKLTFTDVWFSYGNDKYVLKDISFEARAGETIALVGHTGSGKTSIISLINRFYTINRGSIKMDDVSIYDYDLEYLRSRIAVVLQDVFLFSGSVLDNITLRNNNIPKDKVIEAAKAIGVHDFIMRLPGGYDYKVMERGATLSLGQRQLISFIRALLYDPAILILDEATSSIDSESERLIQNAIDTMIRGRTSIVIAHRLSTIRKADRIIVLDQGRIMESGTHDELIARKGAYYKLHKLQFEKQEIEVRE